MTEIEKQFNFLKSGSPVEMKEAKKTIKKLWHKNTKIFNENIDFILEIIKDFDSIADNTHKAAVISGLSLAHLSLADEYFEELKKFIVKNLQNTDGRIREAASDVSSWLYISLSDRANPFVYPEGMPLNEKQKERQVIATKQYIDFVYELETLMDKYPAPDDKTEYIDEMKPSINKSLQKVWSKITNARVYPKILERTRPIPIDIFIKRKEIEKELTEMLEANQSDFDLEDIKEIIFDEDGTDDMTKIIRIFDDGGRTGEIENILDIVSDAWNYFPHRCLDGFCPQEKMLGLEIG